MLLPAGVLIAAGNTPGPRAPTDAIPVAQYINYQGVITPNPGAWNGTFTIWDALIGGNQFWTGTYSIPADPNGLGLYNVQFGSGAFPITTLPEGPNCWLEIAVNGTPLSPRTQLVTVPYAWNAAGLTSNHEGICRAAPTGLGMFNTLYGTQRQTHVNLGIGSTTGTLNQNYVYCTVGGGAENLATADRATVGGGQGNSATGFEATIGGGGDNEASGPRATISGGTGSVASGDGAAVGGGNSHIASGEDATIGGGGDNEASGAQATVGGGLGNAALADNATVAGGTENVASGASATVPGGFRNRAEGDFSFAAGSFAESQNQGCFTWGDASAGYIPNNTDNCWKARTTGGVWFYTDVALSSGAHMHSGDNGWTSGVFDKDLNNTRTIDRKALLERLARMPVHEYSLKSQVASVVHVGPVADDFREAFGYGDGTGISTADADGVSLAAIQALYDELKACQAEIEALKAEVARLRK
jgi:hypothetical protein